MGEWKPANPGHRVDLKRTLGEGASTRLHGFQRAAQGR